MSVQRGIYECSLCGGTIEALTNGGTLNCCGKDMTLLEGNTTEAAVEKHIPVIETIDGGYKVTVGEDIHPMAEDHYIQWIELVEGSISQIKFLNPGEEPVAVFKSAADSVSARAYCNTHGLWKK